MLAQGSSQATDIARTALGAALAQSAVGDSRPGPLLIDVTAFSRHLKAVVGEDVDASEVISSVGQRGRPGVLSTALECTGLPPRAICKVQDDGIYFTLDSVLVAGDRAEAFVRYSFTIYKGAKRDRPYVAFVQVRVEIERGASGWHVVRRHNVLRS
jgi:hypothetical protein